MQELAGWIQAAWDAHQQQARTPAKTTRRHDGKTPYSIHPIWCAMTVLTETALPEAERWILAQALLFHDVPEDTTAQPPDDLRTEAETLIQEMTFDSSDAEMAAVDQMSDRCHLAKLYDKTSNLMDGAWMSVTKREQYVAYTRGLITRVEARYGSLNIVRIAKAICG